MAHGLTCKGNGVGWRYYKRKRSRSTLRWIDNSGVGVYIKGILPGIVERLKDGRYRWDWESRSIGGVSLDPLGQCTVDRLPGS